MNLLGYIIRGRSRDEASGSAPERGTTGPSMDDGSAEPRVIVSCGGGVILLTLLSLTRFFEELSNLHGFYFSV